MQSSRVVDPLLCVGQSSAHATEGERGRCDGHEHADEGLREGGGGVVRSFPFPPSGIVVRKYVGHLGAADVKVHRQEALCRQLAAGPWQVGVL